MIDELKTAQQLFVEADRRLGACVRGIRERFGITDEAIAEESRKMIGDGSKLDG